jgi:hypothetical protein
MVVSIALCALALRRGLELRRSRLRRTRRAPELRRRHLRIARPAVALVVVGLVGGLLSAVFLRDWRPLTSFHGWLGLLAAAGFSAAAVLGHRMERGRSRAYDVHAVLGGVALLAAAVAAVAGFVLLP